MRLKQGNFRCANTTFFRPRYWMTGYQPDGNLAKGLKCSIEQRFLAGPSIRNHFLRLLHRRASMAISAQAPVSLPAWEQPA